MREAMANAEVGDEQDREDPTVLELERRGADLLGQEEAVYLPTATMGNQIALLILGERATEVVVEETAHIVVSELGGAAANGGLQVHGVPGDQGRISSEQIRATMHEDGSFHTPRTSVRRAREHPQQRGWDASGRSTSYGRSLQPHASSGSGFISTARG